MNNNNSNPAAQPNQASESNNNESLQLNKQIQQLLAQLVPQDSEDDQSLN